MPATWKIVDGVLVVSTVDETSVDQLQTVFDEAVWSPSFFPGAPLVIEALRSTTFPNASGMRARIALLCALPLRFFRNRIILVVRAHEPARFRLARQVASGLKPRGVDVQILSDFAIAMEMARQARR